MSGVYISYPFCAQKCTFCNFASGVGTRGDSERYWQALLAEVAAHRWAFEPNTLYLGGGTPSTLPVHELQRLFALLPMRPQAEITMEAAPGSFGEDAVAGWRRCGVNRVSLGVQSFVPEELRRVGRRHTADTVQADVALLRRHDLTDINIDLIAGLPGQTAESWKESLRWIERLAPPHVSVYLFEVDEESRLGKEVLAGGGRFGADRLPSEEATAECYEEALRFLRGLGIERYEISNFARPGCESRHNLKYWRREPYVGFGLDAHSFDGAVRRCNPDTLPDYLAGVQCPAEHPDASEERFLVGLRLQSGFEPSPQEWERFAEPIEHWLQTGLLQRQGSRLAFSDQGFLLSNEILQEFLHVPA